jgi:hypothetical protein
MPTEAALSRAGDRSVATRTTPAIPITLTPAAANASPFLRGRRLPIPSTVVELSAAPDRDTPVSETPVRDTAPVTRTFERIISSYFSRSAAALTPSVIASFRFREDSATCSPRKDATAAALELAFASTMASWTACCISAAVA